MHLKLNNFVESNFLILHVISFQDEEGGTVGVPKKRCPPLYLTV